MCSMYWNLEVTFTCPNCGSVEKDAELQTHWKGEVMSCENRYRLNQPVKELKGVRKAILPDAGDDFIGDCEQCTAWIDFGGLIRGGKVIKVWPLRYHMGSGKAVEIARKE